MKQKVLKLEIGGKTYDVIFPLEAIKRIKELQDPGDELRLNLAPKEEEENE